MAATFSELFERVNRFGGNDEKEWMRLLTGELSTLTQLNINYAPYMPHGSSRQAFSIMRNGTQLAAVKKIDFSNQKITVRLSCMTTSPPLSYSGEDSISRLAGRLKAADICYKRRNS